MERITRRKFIEYSSAALASALFSDRVLSATPPNILLITSDDLGQCLGCYGDAIARTPNLNRLASQGIRFVNGYVTNSSCSSSRSSLFTGLYPHQTGCFTLDNPPSGQIGLAYTGSGYAMDSSIKTIPQLLKAAGYRTGIIGKLHIFPEASFPFDYKMTEENTRNIELVAQRAGEFLAQTQQPFFLKVSYSDPHAPFYTQLNGYPQQPFSPIEVPPFPWQSINTPAVRERMAGYYNGAARLDAGIGMLLNKLTQLGLANNTMVIFIGDHGPGFTRAKGTCYEAGLRVPLMVRWPGRISPNRVNDSLVSTVDILPTVLQAAGVNRPQNLAGQSLMQLFQGNKTDWRSLLFAEYTSHTRTGFHPRRSVRGTRYKYILNLLPNRNNPAAFLNNDIAYSESRKLPVNHPARIAMDTCRQTPAEELYDLEADPIEFNNLAVKLEHQDRKSFLRTELLKWRQKTADPLLDPAVLAAMEQEHYGSA
jgi:N-sulfoglucosamine sulfohydrolase